MAIEYAAWPVKEDTKCANCGAMIKQGELELQWQRDGWSFLRSDDGDWHSCGCAKCEPQKVARYA